jgi:hypothetical protein
MTLRTSLTELAFKYNGIPHALRPFAWAFLALRPEKPADSWQTELGFNPNNLALGPYFERVVSDGLEKWNTFCTKYDLTNKEQAAPCEGFVDLTKDVHRMGTELFGVKLDNLHAKLTADEGKRYPVLTKATTDNYIQKAPFDQSSRVAFYLNMHIAIEELFQKYHGNGPTYRSEHLAEFFQNRPFYPIFFLASILPPEAAFLVRSYMLAEAEPLTAPTKKWTLFEECQNYDTHLFDPNKRSSMTDDIHNSHIFDRVKSFVGQFEPAYTFFLAAENTVKKQDGTFLLGWFDREGTTCKSRDNLLTDLLWRSRDAEPAYRIADLQLLLPRDQARRVVDAAFYAFAAMYEGRLRNYQEAGDPADVVYESISCSVRAIAVKRK